MGYQRRVHGPPPVFYYTPPVYTPVYSPPVTGCVDTQPVCPIWLQMGFCTLVSTQQMCPQSCANAGCTGRRSFPQVDASPDGALVDSRGRPFEGVERNANGNVVDSRGRPLPVPKDLSSPVTDGASSFPVATAIIVAAVGIGGLVLVVMLVRSRRNVATRAVHAQTSAPQAIAEPQMKAELDGQIVLV